MKLSKRQADHIAPKPFTEAKYVDLSDINAKDQFQLICFENNNAAFFADTVVLVEGDSDYLVFPHLAKTINPEWDWMKKSVRFARISGKTSIRRYRDFFRRFDMRTLVITDLDLLVSGFEQVEPCATLTGLRNSLLEAIDQHIKAAEVEPSFNSKQVRETQKSGRARALWQQAVRTHQQFQSGDASFGDVAQAVTEFFALEQKNDRLSILQQIPTVEIREKKHTLLAELRKRHIFVLERGDIEAYYPPGIEGADKPSKAQRLCQRVTCREDALALCHTLMIDDDSEINEFELIFRTIFNNATP